MPTHCATVDPGKAAKGGPKVNDHRLFERPGALQKTTDFRTTSKSTPGVAKSALGRPRAAKSSFFILLGSILGAIFDGIFDTFLGPSKPRFCNTLLHFLRFYTSKKLSFWDPFSITFSTPFWNIPLEELLGPSWPPEVPTLPLHVDFGAFWDPPGVQNGPLERPGPA